MSSPLLFSNEMLQNYGCRNCIWKEMDQCPSNLKGAEILPEGYCSKLYDFLIHLGDGEDSISAVKEKFHLFIQETQSLSDRSEYFAIKSKYDAAILSNSPLSELHELEIRMNNARLCWNRMSEAVVKGLSRVVDREKRVAVDNNFGPRLTVQELNSLLKSNSGVLPVSRDGDSLNTKSSTSSIPSPLVLDDNEVYDE